MNRRIALLALAFSCCAIQASAQDHYCYEKRVHRHYDHITTADTLVINNSFGSVVINTSDRNDIDMDIVTVGMDTNAAKAQLLLNDIVLDAKTTDPHKIICTTTTDYARVPVIKATVPGRAERWNANCTYTINMPKGMPLYIKTSNADVALSDYEGVLDVNINGGHITAGNLTNPLTNIYVNRSEGYENKIASIKEGTVSCANACCAMNLEKKADKKKVTLEGWAPLVIDGRTQ